MPSLLQLLGLPLRVAGDITRMADDLAQVRRQLEPVPSAIVELQGEVDGLTARLASMEQTLERTALGIEPLDDDMSSVERAVHELPPKLDEVAAQLDALRTDLSGLPFVQRS